MDRYCIFHFIFRIQSANLCFFIREFNLFTFSIITNKEGFTSAIWYLFSIRLINFLKHHYIFLCLVYFLFFAVKCFDPLHIFLVCIFFRYLDNFFVATKEITLNILNLYQSSLNDNNLTSIAYKTLLLYSFVLSLCCCHHKLHI